MAFIVFLSGEFELLYLIKPSVLRGGGHAVASHGWQVLEILRFILLSAIQS